MGKILLPSHRAAMHSLENKSQESAWEIRHKEDYRPGEQLKNSDVLEIARSMSFSANGAFRSVHMTEHNNVLAGLQTSLKRAAHHGEHDIDPGLTEPISIYEFCVKNAETGRITISPRAAKILRTYMRLDNATGIYNKTAAFGSSDRLIGSRGCPASATTVRMRPDDLTERQMMELTRGERPIASYNPSAQELTLLRSPIAEYNYLLSDFICRQASAAQSQTAQTYPR